MDQEGTSPEKAEGIPPEKVGGMTPEKAVEMPPEKAGGTSPEKAGGMPPREKKKRLPLSEAEQAALLKEVEFLREDKALVEEDWEKQHRKIYDQHEKIKWIQMIVVRQKRSIEHLEGELQEKDEELKQLRAKVEQFEKEKERQQNMEEMEGTLPAKTTEVEALLKKLEEMQVENEMKERRISELTTNVEVSTGELAGKRKKVKELTLAVEGSVQFALRQSSVSQQSLPPEQPPPEPSIAELKAEPLEEDDQRDEFPLLRDAGTTNQESSGSTFSSPVTPDSSRLVGMRKRSWAKVVCSGKKRPGPGKPTQKKLIRLNPGASSQKKNSSPNKKASQDQLEDEEEDSATTSNGSSKP